MFYENRFSSLSKQRNLHISTNVDVEDSQQGLPLDIDENLQLDEQQDVDPIHRRSKRQRQAKSIGLDSEVYLVEDTRNKIHSIVPYLLNVEGDPLTYGDAMASHYSVF